MGQQENVRSYKEKRLLTGNSCVCLHCPGEKLASPHLLQADNYDNIQPLCDPDKSDVENTLIDI